MKLLIVANWKCHPKTLREAKLLFNSIIKGVKDIDAEVVICPPFVYLPVLKATGAQDVFWENEGAYTGEISPAMLKNLGLKYVIVGHSERRKYRGETDVMINQKVKASLAQGLKPILCIDKISQIPDNLGKGAVIAYEPLFAIGTGQTCGIEKAKKMRLAIKRRVGAKTLILYGGSVSSHNAQEYIMGAGFQGLLVGGASLRPKEFVDIIKNVCYR